MTGSLARGIGGVVLVLGFVLSVGRLEAQAPVERPLSLEDALQLALPASEAVGIARAGVQRAQGDQKRAKSGYFPQLGASAGYTRTLKSQFSIGDSTISSQPCPVFVADTLQPIPQRVDSLEGSVSCLSAANPFASFGTLPFGQRNAWSLGLGFSQNLFTGGQLSGRSQAASAGHRSAEIGLTAAEAQLTLVVTQAYYDALLGDRLVEIAEASLDQADTTLVQTRLAREVGTQPEFELLRAQVTRDNQRPVVIQRRSSRDIAYLRLKQLLHLPLDQALNLTTDLGDTTTSVGATLDSLLSSPADTSAAARAPVRQASEAVTAQEGLLKAAKGLAWPQAVLSSQFAELAYPSSVVPNTSDFLTDWTITLGVQLPLYTGGRIKGDKMVAEANLQESKLRLQQTQQLAELDARDAIAQLDAALASWEASRGTVEQATRAYEIADLRYREGISTQTELLDSRLQLRQAEANRAIVARNLQISRVRLALLANLPFGTEPTPLPFATEGQQPSLPPLVGTTASSLNRTGIPRP